MNSSKYIECIMSMYHLFVGSFFENTSSRGEKTDTTYIAYKQLNSIFVSVSFVHELHLKNKKTTAFHWTLNVSVSISTRTAIAWKWYKVECDVCHNMKNSLLIVRYQKLGMKLLSGWALRKSLRSLPIWLPSLRAIINNCITYRFHKQYRQRFTYIMW